MSRTLLRYVCAGLVGLGIFSVPLAFAYATSVSVGNLSGTSVSVGQNVSFTVAALGFTNPTYALNDSFGNSSAGSGDINSSGSFSWTPNGSDVGTHTFTIAVSDSAGDATTTVQEAITVSPAPSVSIQNLSPSSSVIVGQTVSFNVVTNGFNSPSYSVSDSFGSSGVTNPNISSGNFSWTPSSAQTGVHTITITVTDSSGHSASASETITVAAASSAGTTGSGGATIQGLSPGNTVIVGNPVSFTVAASGFSNPVFTAQDSFGGSSMSNSDMNSAGYFSWTPNSSDIGTHTITIYVNDSSGHSGNVTLAITVQTPNIAITSITPGSTVTPNTVLSFTVSPAGFTNPSYTINDSFSGTSISNADINSSGAFSWTPATNQTGTHTITVYATDSAGHSANTSITVNVNSGVSVSLTAPSPNTSVAAGTAISFQTYAYGFTSPAYSLQDSFSGTSISNADINSSGAFSWVPTANDAGIHTITVAVNDSYSHYGTAQTTITVSAGTGTASSASASATLPALQAQLQSLLAQVAALQGGSSATASAGTSSGHVFSVYLSPGSTGDDVTALQTILAQQGFFTGSVTGYYGALTEAAVEQYQAAHGLDQLGVVGPATRALLNQSSPSSASPSASASGGYVFSNFLDIGSTGTDVTELQTRLTALGMYSGPVTGYFGSLTQAAVEQFQGAHGIDQVGYVGPATRAALNQ
jgi:peptidoglycan hydrolase-like protein with peptidoglycan-binding domain